MTLMNKLRKLFWARLTQKEPCSYWKRFEARMNAACADKPLPEDRLLAAIFRDSKRTDEEIAEDNADPACGECSWCTAPP